jgi:hypothetical protein
MIKRAIAIMLLLASVAGAGQYYALHHARRGRVTDAWAAAGLNEGLVSYWAMRTNGTTTVYDEYGAYDMTASGAAGWFAADYGKRDLGIRFNNTDRQLSVGKDAGDINIQIGDGITIAAWIKLRNANKTGGFADRDMIVMCNDSAYTDRVQYGFSTIPGGTNGTSLLFQFNKADSPYGAVTFNTADGGVYPLSDAETWYHVAVAAESLADGGAIRFYVDGSAVYAATNTFECRRAANKVVIGYENRNLRWADADMDEIPIWNRSLSQDEITALYSTPLYSPYKE